MKKFTTFIIILTALFSLGGCASVKNAANVDSFSQEELWFSKGEQKIYGVLSSSSAMPSIAMTSAEEAGPASPTARLRTCRYSRKRMTLGLSSRD